MFIPIITSTSRIKDEVRNVQISSSAFDPSCYNLPREGLILKLIKLQSNSNLLLTRTSHSFTSDFITYFYICFLLKKKKKKLYQALFFLIFAGLNGANYMTNYPNFLLT